MRLMLISAISRRSLFNLALIAMNWFTLFAREMRQEAHQLLLTYL